MSFPVFVSFTLSCVLKVLLFSLFMIIFLHSLMNDCKLFWFLFSLFNVWNSQMLLQSKLFRYRFPLAMGVLIKDFNLVPYLWGFLSDLPFWSVEAHSFIFMGSIPLFSLYANFRFSNFILLFICYPFLFTIRPMHLFCNFCNLVLLSLIIWFPYNTIPYIRWTEKYEYSRLFSICACLSSSVNLYFPFNLLITNWNDDFSLKNYCCRCEISERNRSHEQDSLKSHDIKPEIAFHHDQLTNSTNPRERTSLWGN